jgi:glycosyltransferase involved in cell wall biosynthesis
MARTIHQLTPTFHDHDALGQHTKELHCLIKELGCRSYIWSSESRRSKPARNAKRFRAKNSDARIIIYQAVTGSPLVEEILKSEAKLVVNYHNITPSRYFDQWSPDLASDLRRGRRQLVELSDRADLAITDSEYNAAELRSLGFSNVEVIPVLFRLQERGEQKIRVAPLPSGSQWLFIGRIVPNKAQHDLITAFAAYRELYDSEARLVLIGAGLTSYKKAVEELISKLDLRRSIKIIDSVTEEEKRQYFSSSDVYVSLSEHEGFGIPLIEAMHYGLPVVAYDAAAVRETLNGEGLLLDFKTPVEVAEVVNEIFQDPNVFNDLVSGGYRRSEEISLKANLEAYKESLLPLISI